MDYMTIKEASEKWGLSIRRMQEICVSGRVPGVVKFGREWAIPKFGACGDCRVTLKKIAYLWAL